MTELGIDGGVGVSTCNMQLLTGAISIFKMGWEGCKNPQVASNETTSVACNMSNVQLYMYTLTAWQLPP